MAAIHRHNTGTDDLRHIGAGVDTERNRGNDVVRQRNAAKHPAENDEIDHHQLYHRRGAAHNGDVAVGKAGNHFAQPDHRAVAGQVVHILQLRDREQQTDGHTDQRRQRGQQQRPSQALQQQLIAIFFD